MPRGFAAMSPEKRREAARKGGIAAHRLGVAHEFTPEEAKVAGKRGGVRTSDLYDMADLGKRGGNKRWRNEVEEEEE